MDEPFVKLSEAELFTLSDSEFRNLRYKIEIKECGEPLIELPSAFLRFPVQPYVKAGAPYGKFSPFTLRKGVVERLRSAQSELERLKKDHKLIIWDGFRPVAVQHYMIEHSIVKLAKERALDPLQLSENQREELRSAVHSIWALPDENPKTPPPHSTGGAIDLTIAGPDGTPIDMGSEIDVMPPLSLPNHFMNSSDALDKRRHENRQLLNTVMRKNGFWRVRKEWWHFSYGDQIWALFERHLENAPSTTSCYGRADLL